MLLAIHSATQPHTSKSKMFGASWLVFLVGHTTPLEIYSIRQATLTIRYDKQFDTTGEVDHVVYCDRLFRISTSQIFNERNRFIIFQLEEMGEETSYVS